MLTLRKPIKLKANSPIRRKPSMQPNTMRLNYGLISSRIEPEDLLHLVTAPAQLFLAEGSVTNVLSGDTNRIHQESKLEVINNFLNRIILNENGHYTYQDRVYISNVLHQLGIQNEEKFMSMVQELKHHTDNTNRLINIYGQHSEIIHNLIQNVQEGRENGGRAQASAEKAQAAPERYYMQDEVFRRLDTKAVYDIVNAWQTVISGSSTQIKNEAVRLGDQTKLSQVMQLHELKNNTVNNEQSLYYLHANPYETGVEPENGSITEKSVTRELVSAVMLNLIDNIYSSVSGSIEKHQTDFIDATNVFFHAADNTFSRFESFHNENAVIQDNTEQFVEEVNRNEKEEIKVLNEFIENAMPLYLNRTENTENDTELHNRTQQFLNSSETVNSIRNIAQNVQQERGGDSIINSQEISPKELHFNSVEEQVAYYEKQNSLIHERLVQIEKKTPKVTEVRVDRERAKRDALRALEHPEELIKEYTTERTEHETENRIDSRYEALISNETKEVLKRLEEMKASPERAEGTADVMDSEQAVQLLQQDIIESERVQLEHPAPAESTVSTVHEKEMISETVNNLTERLIEHVNRIPQENATPESAGISMTHRKVEQAVDEETVQELIRQNRLELTAENRTEKVSTTQTAEKVINNVSREVHNEYHEDINELISRGVRKEMSTISNEVMRKLEQRMQLERSRRGY